MAHGEHHTNPIEEAPGGAEPGCADLAAESDRVESALKDLVDQVLEGENPDDLQALKDQLRRIEKEFQNRRKSEMVKKAEGLERIALSEGFSSLSDAARCLNEVRTRNGESLAYVNPDNASQVWEGRGRRPKWISDQLRAGRNLSEILTSRQKRPTTGT